MIARSAAKTITAARIAFLTAGLGLASLAFALPATVPIGSNSLPAYMYVPVAASTATTAAGTSVVSFRASSLGSFGDPFAEGLDARTSRSISDAFKIVSVRGPAGVSVTLDSATLTAADVEAGTDAMVALGFTVTTPALVSGSTPVEVTLENTRTGEQTVIGLRAIIN